MPSRPMGLCSRILRDMVGGEEDVGKANADEGAALGAFDELQRCTEDDGAGAFAADQGAGNVEVVFGEQLVEVEAGDAARDVEGILRGPDRRRCRECVLSAA